MARVCYKWPTWIKTKAFTGCNKKIIFQTGNAHFLFVGSFIGGGVVLEKDTKYTL